MRFSVRYKILLVTSVVVLAAVVTYLYLAASLLVRDKLAYIFDLNSALVETLSEEARSNLAILGEQLGALGRQLSATDPANDGRTLLAREAWKRNPDLLAVGLYSAQGNPSQPLYRAFNDKLGEELAVTEADLDRVRKNRPLPLGAMGSLGLHVQNDSLPPEAPLLTVAVDAGDGLVVSGTLRPTRLLRIFREAGHLYRGILVDERGVVLAHPEAKQVLEARSLASQPLVRIALESKAERGVREVEQGGQTIIGAYGRVERPRMAILAEVPRSEALRGARELVRRSTLFAGAIVAAALLTSVFLARRLTSPLRRLAEATRDVARGQYIVDLPAQSNDEIGDLTRAFVQMGRDLLDREQKLQETQAQLVESAKLAAFGQMGAGITHEVKNPLTGIIGFAQIANMKLLQLTGEAGKSGAISTGAGGAGGKDGSAPVAKDGAAAPAPRPTEIKVDIKSYDTIKQCAQGIEGEAKRCLEIVQNFLRFARRERVEFKAADVNKVVDDVAKLVRHQLSVNNVRLNVETQTVPSVQANSGQLEQVLLNLVINAQQAMTSAAAAEAATNPRGAARNQGIVTVTTRATERGGVELRVSDNGPGMPAEVRARIFEPFFTTKPKGEGTGLGLSVSYGIVQSHRGKLTVETEVGKGTTFVIELPPEAEGPLSFGGDASGAISRSGEMPAAGLAGSAAAARPAATGPIAKT
jgi:signal transduction histidine kinase